MRDPDFVIGRPGKPYLLRWWVIQRNRWFNIYLHQILENDDDRALTITRGSTALSSSAGSIVK